MENKNKKSEDYDLFYYNELDESKKLVSKYIVKYFISKYPPFSQYIEYQKYDLDGKLLEEKRI
ncbi:hypothetical protein ACH5BK_10705 [Arcobacter sp. YIC-80]|uniref:hypothetical protein n=1 Tax=Arcobacter sp. YIC-80 TaxID=3376683 RepID=UPI00384B48FC